MKLESNRAARSTRIMRVIQTSLALLIAFPLLVSSQDSLTMNQVVSEVVRNNNRAEAARFMERSAEANIGSQGAWPDPMLMFGIQNTPTDFDLDMDPMTMKMVGISQDIPYSGYLGLQRKAARASAEAARSERAVTEIDLATTARQAYIDLYFKQSILDDLIRQRELLQQIVTSATAKFRSNQATQDEVLAAQSNQWRLESMILSAQQELDAARYSLNALRGVRADSPLPALAAPDNTLPPDSVDAWLELARAHYPPLKQLASQSESYRLSAAASRRMIWPMLNLQAEYGFRSGYETGEHGEPGEPRDDMISLRASFSLPIFSRGQQKSMARSMEAMQRSSSFEAEQVWRDTEAAVRSLYQRALRLRQSIDLYENRVLPASEDAYRSGLSGYSANRTPFTGLLNYQIAILQDKTTLTQLRADYARTLTEVSRYTVDPSQWTATQSEQSEG